MLTTIYQPSSLDLTSRTDKASQMQTVEFGIQVDFNQNPQNQENLLLCQQDGESLQPKNAISAEQRKKLKKKQNKRKKKEKVAQVQRQARRKIGNIIQQLYERRASFEDYQQQIQSLVQQVYNNDFRDYLDQLIRMRVNYIQKTIWQYTQSILYQNPFERNQDHVFYSQMVDQIYQKYLEIEESSREIEKIINIYLKFAYQKNESKEEIVYNNLAVNTFNYMIETDQTLKNLLHICDKKITDDKEAQRKKLNELISIIDSYYEEYHDEYDQNSTNCPQDELQSTGFSEDEEICEEKRKKKRKIKENDLIAEEQVLMRRLNSLLIREQERIPCRISQQTVSRWRDLAEKYRPKPNKL